MKTSGKTLREIATFMIQHYEPWRTRSMRWIRQYLHYLEELGTLSLAIGEAGEIRGVIAWRKLRSVEDAETPYYHSPAGRIAWLDLLVAIDPAVIAQLIRESLQCHGAPDLVMWWREAKPNGCDRYRIFRYDQCEKIFKMLTRKDLYGRG